MNAGVTSSSQHDESAHDGTSNINSSIFNQNEFRKGNKSMDFKDFGVASDHNSIHDVGSNLSNNTTLLEQKVSASLQNQLKLYYKSALQKVPNRSGQWDMMKTDNGYLLSSN